MDSRIRLDDTTLEKEGTIGAHTLGSVGVVDGGPNGTGVGSHWGVQLGDERKESKGSLHVNSAYDHLHLVMGIFASGSFAILGEFHNGSDFDQLFIRNPLE